MPAKKWNSPTSPSPSAVPGWYKILKFSTSILAPTEDMVKMRDQYLSDNHDTNVINKTLNSMFFITDSMKTCITDSMKTY